MSHSEREFEAQFAELGHILQELSTSEINEDQLKFHSQVAVGSGGFGDLHRATKLDDPESSNILAVKILRAEGTREERAHVAVRLIREIRIMSTLLHRNIVPFIGFHVDRKEFKTAWIITPYMTNGNVREYLGDHDVNIQKRLELALEVGQGLLYLHSREPPICHADIKLENILVTDDIHVVICDFGISQILSTSKKIVTTSSVKGSIPYMSPELFSGSSSSTLSDVWAWGCLVLCVTSGKYPYSTLKTPHSVVGHISQGIKPAPVGTILAEIPYLLHLLDACWQFEAGRRLGMGKCVSILSNIVGLQDDRDRFPAVAVLHGLSGYRINRDHIKEFEAIGHGGSGTVTAAQLSEPAQGSPSDVVIKKLALGDDEEDTIKRRSMIFAREVGLLSQLSHSNIIRFIGFVEDLQNGVAWIITPRARRGNVREFLLSGTWGLSHRTSLMWDIATGVEYLHTFRPPIIHGDLKSVNVVVNEEGHAEIIDFGSARMIEAPDLEGAAYSTRWASPEMLKDGRASLESDIWALGWTFWEVLTGRIPHDAIKDDAAIVLGALEEKFSSFENTDVVQTQTLRDLLQRCWRKDPKERPKASACSAALAFMPQTTPVRMEA